MGLFFLQHIPFSSMKIHPFNQLISFPPKNGKHAKSVGISGKKCSTKTNVGVCLPLLLGPVEDLSKQFFQRIKLHSNMSVSMYSTCFFFSFFSMDLRKTLTFTANKIVVPQKSNDATTRESRPLPLHHEHIFLFSLGQR